MTDDTPLRVDTTPDPELHVDAEAGEAFKLTTYEIAPEDRHIADAILALDPLTDVPSPFKGFEGIKAPEMNLSSLPPAMRDSVEKQLTYTPPGERPEAEAKLVRAALEQHSREVRTRAGVGEGALPIHQTMAELAADHRALGRQFNAISEQLFTVARHDTRTDPETGERIPVPVYAVEGFAREKLVQEQDRINYRMKLLEGIEGQRLMEKALGESVALVKQRNAQMAEEAEVQGRAERLVRESRLDRRAAVRARMIDPSVGSRD